MDVLFSILVCLGGLSISTTAMHDTAAFWVAEIGQENYHEITLRQAGVTVRAPAIRTLELPLVGDVLGDQVTLVLHEDEAWMYGEVPGSGCGVFFPIPEMGEEQEDMDIFEMFWCRSPY